MSQQYTLRLDLGSTCKREGCQHTRFPSDLWTIYVPFYSQLGGSGVCGPWPRQPSAARREDAAGMAVPGLRLRMPGVPCPVCSFPRE